MLQVEALVDWKKPNLYEKKSKKMWIMTREAGCQNLSRNSEMLLKFRTANKLRTF